MMTLEKTLNKISLFIIPPSDSLVVDYVVEHILNAIKKRTRRNLLVRVGRLRLRFDRAATEKNTFIVRVCQ